MPGVSDSQAQPISRALIARLRRVLGEDAVLTRPAQLLPYETDAMPLHQGRPGLVLLPAKTSQVVRTIKLLHDASVPWVPRGAGTGLSGGAVASASAAVLSVAKLRRVIQTDPARRRVRVEPGVVNLKLNESLHCHGLHFAPDPSSQMAATIGGNIAENAGGAHTLKYGVTSQHVLGLHLVLANGRALEIGGEEETMGGYDLMSFIVGSEGTLGLVADATLRLMPLPEATSTFMAVFASVSDASAAVGGILREGVVPAALEMIDSVVLRTLEEVFHVGFPLDAGALLVGEIDGLRESVDAQVRVVKQVLASCGVTDVQFAQTEKDREKLWEARKKAFGALGRVAPNYISHDAVIPRSCLPEVLARIAQVAERNDLRIANIFHAGDGNLHPAILFDGADAEQSRRAREAGEQIMRICLEAGGVLTGEHGVGMSKRHAMRWVFTEAELELMDGLRRVFDPWRRVNPGKILPVLSSDRDLDNTDSDGVGRVRAAGQDLPGLLPDSKAENPAHDRNVPQPRRHLSTFERAVSDAIREAVRKREGVVPIGGGTLLMVPLVHAQQVREAAGARDTGSGSAAPEETGSESTAPEETGSESTAPEETGSESAAPEETGSESAALEETGSESAALGETVSPSQIRLDTRGADRILRFDPADFAITVEAGVTLAKAAAAVAQERQRLAWEAPDPERSTLGGLASAGYWASMTQELGHPKHSLLGFRAITGTGEVIEFGGRVVKNVTGYDVGKLLLGSRGTLAILTRLTLRTYPIPKVWALAVVEGDTHSLLDLASRLWAVPLGWSLIDLATGPEGRSLLIGLDGGRVAVDRRWRELQAIEKELRAVKAGAASEIHLQKIEAEEALARRRQAADALHWGRAALVGRIVTSPERTCRLARRVLDLCAAGGRHSWTHRVQCHLGVGLVRFAFEPGFQEVAARRLLLDVAGVVREIGGYRALDRAPNHPLWGWDAWGVSPVLQERMQHIRMVFDPRGVLMPWPQERAMGGAVR